MVIGFHYHIPIKKSAEGRLHTQSFYGLFLDSLSEGCEKLIVFSYSPLKGEEDLINYELRSSNISMIDLGPHNSLPKRIMRFRASKNIIEEQINFIDILLIRSPTPLLPVFALLRNRKKIIMYIVGNFLESARGLPFWRIKTIIIKLLGLWLEHTQNKLAFNNIVIGNNQYLLDRYNKLASEVILIKSTTLSPTDFFKRDDTCTGAVIRVLYTGRIDPLKGLFEILAACERLACQGIEVEFHLAGLPVKGLEFVPEQLMNTANRGALKGRVIYHGLKKVGDELNKLYRMADIYIIATKGMEGFPRTIWEAMANGLPVLASRLGAIPLFLNHGSDALLLEPGSIDNIEESLLNVINDQDLRQALILNGYKLAKENTLEMQGKIMTQTLHKIVSSVHE